MPTILVVEDDPLIGMALAQSVEAEFEAKAALVTTVAGALECLAGEPVDFALLDINLRNENTFALARQLASMGIPFAFTSGSSRAHLPEDLQLATFLSKPCTTRDVVQALCFGVPELRAARCRPGA